MIRLAVSGDEEQWDAVALRLRGATIDCCLESNPAAIPMDLCDAVLFLGSACPKQWLLEDCLSHGRHVLICVTSKLARSVPDLLLNIAKQAGVQFSVVNPDQYRPSRQLILQQLASGKLGVPGLVRMHRWGRVVDSASEPSRNPFAIPNVVARDLDLAIRLFGRSPTVVHAVEASYPAVGFTLGRAGHVHLGFSDDGMALIDYASSRPPGYGYQSLSVIGSSGAAYEDDHQNMQLVFKEGTPQAALTDEGTRPLVNLIQEFVDAVRDKRDLTSSVTQWADVLTVVYAVERSMATRQAVTPAALGGSAT